MTDSEKIEKLQTALNKINRLIYAAGAPLGTKKYFMIRQTCVDTLTEVGADIK